MASNSNNSTGSSTAARRVEAFGERYSALQRTEEERNRFIEDLLHEVTTLTTSLSETNDHLEREKTLTALYQREHREMESQVRGRDKIMDSNKFVSVIIDGDCMHFLDDLIQSHDSSSNSGGGGEAAQRLRNAVIKYLHEKIPDMGDVEVVIRVYANIEGLARAYCDSKILSTTAQFRGFVRAFNMAHALCDFVDAGNGKECSDDKIKALFKLHAADVHCKHIIFGGSADNGYARLLMPYSGDKAVANRTTMLEGPPFAPELSRLTDKFRVVSFDNVFKDTKLQTRFD